MTRPSRLHPKSIWGYDILYGTDDTSVTTINPAMFEEFCLGYTDRVVDAVHAGVAGVMQARRYAKLNGGK